jgi:hypothetical protein
LLPLGAHLAILGPLSATKRIRFLFRLRLADRVAVLIGTNKQAPTKMSGGNEGNWVCLTSKGRDEWNFLIEGDSHNTEKGLNNARPQWPFANHSPRIRQRGLLRLHDRQRARQ